MRILAFTGKKKSGKTTLANLIKARLTNCDHVNFADALKREVTVACGVELVDIELHKDVYRTILQWWGTEFRRVHQKDNDYWTKRLLKTLTLKTDDTVIVCSDVRFDNEAWAIKEIGGRIIHVVNPDLACDGDMHASERGIDFKYIDEMVENPSSRGLAVLEQTADRLLKKYLV